MAKLSAPALPKTQHKERASVDIGHALKLRLKNHLSYQQIGIRLGTSAQTIQQRLKRFESLIDDPQLLSAYRDNRADLIDAAHMALLPDLLDPAKRESASINNLAYALKQLHEMGRLERGLATSHVDISAVQKDAVDIEARISALDAELIAVEVAPPPVVLGPSEGVSSTGDTQ